MTEVQTPPHKEERKILRLRKRNAEHQKAWRKRRTAERKAKFAEALAMLTAIGDDEPITVTGKEYGGPLDTVT